MLKYLFIIGFVFIAVSSCKKNEDAIQNTIVTAPAINNIKKHQPVVITGSNSVNDSIVWQVQPIATFTTNANTATFIFNTAGVYTILAKTTTITTKFIVTVNDSDYNPVVMPSQYFYYTIFTATDSVIKGIADSTSFFSLYIDTLAFPAFYYIQASKGQFGSQNYASASITFYNNDTTLKDASFTNTNPLDSSLSYQQSNVLKITKYAQKMGDYIEGNFTGVYKRNQFDIEEKTIKGNFKIKRTQ